MLTASRRLLGWVLAALGGLALLAVIGLPLGLRVQAEFAAGAVVLFALVSPLPGRAASLALAALSAAMSLRYLAWRLTDTLDFATWPELCLGAGLVAAESYAVATLLLGYGQSVWPLRRQPLPLPDDPARWPSLDVFVPTYDEPLPVVRTTVLAALAMDWPGDRLQVWLLDDGARPAFAALAAEAGCRYLARSERGDAKAGNLNHALTRSAAEFVAVFDCDHVPTRAFAQLTLGWLVHRPNLAFVQTPQHFYSPDPFQRNLAAGRRAPPESGLFHFLLQDGRDTFNAAMFSGSCAVLRRAALEDVGGFATGTLTEDALTSLQLHRRGWDSAFLRLPLAAGLAPESVADHIRQRRRWMRGMLAILRRDNPLLGRGLSLGQRLCYLQASWHFLFPVARLALLTAPLAFLLFGRSVIAAAPLAVAAYAAPHLLCALATSARLHRRWRGPLWGQLYETVLALPLLPTTLAALLRPGRARFVVTPKGGAAADVRFAWRSALPNLVLAAALAAGCGQAIAALLAGPLRSPDGAVLFNAVWAALALLLVLAALAVCRERPGRVRIAAALPVTVHFPDGGVRPGVTDGIGQRGANLAIKVDADMAEGTPLRVGFRIGDEDIALPARVLGRDGLALRVAWTRETLEQEARIVRVVFGRADAWTGLPEFSRVGPIARLLLRRRAVAAIGATLLLGAAAAHGQTPPASDFSIRPVPGAAEEPTPAAPPPAAPAPAAPAPAASAPAAPAPAASAPPGAAAGSRTVIYTLRQLGAGGPLSLRGTTPLLGVSFGIRADEVVTAATLSLSGAVSPGLMPEASNVTVTLNGQYVATIPADRRTPAFTLDVPIAPATFTDADRLEFRLAGRVSADCDDPLSGLLWATIADSSTLTLTLARLPAQRDLARLPAPFLDPHDPDALALPFVLAAVPGDDALRAAGIAASWFGQLAGRRGADFPVSAELPQTGDAVLVLAGSDGPAVRGLPPIAGPTLAVLPNPHDPLASVLLIAGRTGEEAATAATALALGIRVLGGAVATVQAPDVAAREPYDAPAWLPTDRPVKLSELAPQDAMQVSGYAGLVRVPFRTAPDLYSWGDRPFALDLRWRAPPGPVIDVAASRLDVGLNGDYLASLPLAGHRNAGWLGRLMGPPSPAPDAAEVPVPPDVVSGANELQLYFDARPLRRATCGAIPGDLTMGVGPDSTLDLSHAYRFARMPDLEFFAAAGFPFTRLADLSQTAIVLPDRPAPGEIAAFLDLMGRFGAITGLPGTRVAVVRPGDVGSVADRDLLMVGSMVRLQAADPLLAGSPVRMSGDRVQMTLGQTLDPLRSFLSGGVEDDDDAAEQRARAAAALSAPVTGGMALLVGAESPMTAGRSVVALLSGSGPALDSAMRSLGDPTQVRLVRGDLALLSGGQVTSYRVGPTYTVGSLPFWLWPGWYLRGQPFAALGVLAAGCVLLALGMYWGLSGRSAARLRARRDDR